jgi:glyoxylase-like metal-dependent hydrolase (beta-lactamase superfamily II)
VADVALVRADNPSPLTLEGTNTWLLGRDPCWVVDPGPDLPDHVEAVVAAARARGGAGGVVLTHRHADHAGALEAVTAALGAPAGEPGPLRVLPTPGHTPDHVAFAFGDVVCTGDAVLGRGSVFVAGQLAAYLDALRALRDLRPAALLPGHGPRIEDPQAKLGEVLEHRAARERGLVAALDAGARTVDELLDRAWADAPAVLRPAAALSLRAHLEKLEQEGRLPAGVERPALPGWAREA